MKRLRFTNVLKSSTVIGSAALAVMLASCQIQPERCKDFSVLTLSQIRALGDRTGFKVYEVNPVLTVGEPGEWDAGALGSMRTDEGWGLLEEWICSFFPYYCCDRSVAGVNPCVRGECEQLCFYARNELVMIASGEIGPANGASKECIADKDHVFGF